MTRIHLTAAFALFLIGFAAPAFALTTEQGSTLPLSRNNVTDPDEQQPAFVAGVGEDGDGSSSPQTPRGFDQDHVMGPRMVRPGFSAEDRMGIPTPYNTPSR